LRLRADSASGYRFAAIATLAAAVAGITLLSGMLELQLSALRSVPVIGVESIPGPTWPNVWLGATRSAAFLQSAAMHEWLNVVLALLLTILILASISALIALFAHVTARRYEVALFAVVGATRARITREHLRRAALNAAIALVIGVPIGLVAGQIAHRAWPQVSKEMSASGWIMVSAVLTCALAGLVARSAAARMSKSGWLGDVLAPEARSNPGYGAEDLRGVLLQLQFAFTFALLAAALLVWQQSRRAQASALPVARASHITRAAISESATVPERRALHQQLERAGYATATPGALIGVGQTDQIVSDCGPCVFNYMPLPMFAMRTQQHVVSSQFFTSLGMTLRHGREFAPEDADARHIIVNDTFAHLAFQGQHAIGKSILVGGLRGIWYTVIGVAADLPISGLLTFNPDEHGLVKSNDPGHEPAIYFYAAERPPAVFDVVSDAAAKLAIAGVSIAPARSLSSVRAAARAPARWFAGVLGALAIAAAVIAVLSLAALTLLNVRQRELEIAARRSVGARRRDIVRMVLTDSMKTAARGTLIGIVLSMAVARAIQMVLPGMAIFDAQVIGLCAIALGTVSLIAAVIPARVAASVMPAQIRA
jgi:ABC-type antimicrobial peptide transport system permease subunit